MMPSQKTERMAVSDSCTATWPSLTKVCANSSRGSTAEPALSSWEMLLVSVAISFFACASRPSACARNREQSNASVSFSFAARGVPAEPSRNATAHASTVFAVFIATSIGLARPAVKGCANG